MDAKHPVLVQAQAAEAERARCHGCQGREQEGTCPLGEVVGETLAFVDFHGQMQWPSAPVDHQTVQLAGQSALA